MNNSWEAVRLEDVVEIASGQVDPTESPYSDMPHVGGDNIESETGRLVNVRTASELGLTSGKYAFDEKDVLYSKIRPALNKVVAPDFKGICSADIYPIRPLNGKLCREYLVYLFRSKDFLSYAGKHSSRTNIPKINREALLAYEALLPPLSEQRRIAAILDKADAIRRKREEGIRLTEELLRSTFLEMFGDPVANPKRWDAAKLSELCVTLSDGPFGSNLKSEHYTDHGIRVVRLQNIGSGEWLDDNSAFISEEHFRSLSRYHCRPGDVLIGTLGDPNLRACVLPQHVGSALNKADCIQARVDATKAVGEFLCAYLNTPGALALVSKMLHGQTRVRVSMGQLKDLPVYVPPLTLQRDFQVVYAKSFRMKSCRSRALLDTETLFASLTQRAFRGEL